MDKTDILFNEFIAFSPVHRCVLFINLSMVTLVPLPGTERTRTLSIKLSMTANPKPARSPPRVVNSGSIAWRTSIMPHPRSLILMRTSPSANSPTHMYISPHARGIGVDDAVL